MAEIPKLGTQWKIIHEFKPTAYLQEVDPTMDPVGLSVGAGKPAHSAIIIDFWPPNMSVLHCFIEDDNPVHAESRVVSSQLPKVGEWTRIEVSHEEVGGRYFLSLSVGGREVGRTEAGPDLRKLTDVKIVAGKRQPGFVRRLVILEKH